MRIETFRHVSDEGRRVFFILAYVKGVEQEFHIFAKFSYLSIRAMSRRIEEHVCRRNGGNCAALASFIATRLASFRLMTSRQQRI